jgi:hypothetical protein
MSRLLLTGFLTAFSFCFRRRPPLFFSKILSSV